MIKNDTRAWIVRVQNVTASRNLDVEYTNQTGRTLFVQVSLRCQTLLNTDVALAAIIVSGISVHVFGHQLFVADITQSVSFVVPPGAKYKIVNGATGTGSLTKIGWTEAF